MSIVKNQDIVRKKIELEIEQSLKKFLREKRVLTKFKKNIKKCLTKSIETYYITNINFPFHWSDTEEGHNFWSNLDKQFSTINIETSWTDNKLKM